MTLPVTVGLPILTILLICLKSGQPEAAIIIVGLGNNQFGGDVWIQRKKQLKIWGYCDNMKIVDSLTSGGLEWKRSESY